MEWHIPSSEEKSLPTKNELPENIFHKWSTNKDLTEFIVTRTALQKMLKRFLQMEAKQRKQLYQKYVMCKPTKNRQTDKNKDNKMA